MNSAVGLILAFLPAPQGAQEAAPVPRTDVIRLVGGEEIVGTVLKQVGNYIEVRLGEGTVVGFERSRVVSIVRAAPSADALAPGLAPRDEWFVLGDAEGMTIGHLHDLVQVAADGSTRVSEEWFFRNGRSRTQVTVLETLNRDLSPQSCFYHERVISPDDRLLSEHLVTGEVKGPDLHVVIRNLKGVTKRSYPFAETALFPLVFREKLRQRPAISVRIAHQELFDPKNTEFRIWNASTTARRRVELRGKTVEVREIVLDDGIRKNREWIDGAAAVARREVNGAALVATPAPRATALAAEHRRFATGAGTAVVASLAKDLALWIPNPIWKASTCSRASVSLEAPLYEAEVTLMELDQIVPSSTLDSASDALVRWMRLAKGKELTVRGRRSAVLLRGVGLAFDAEWRVDRVGESRAFGGTCYVFKTGGRSFALLMTGPRESLQQLALDFERIRDSMQLQSQDVAPVAQGPLAR